MGPLWDAVRAAHSTGKHLSLFSFDLWELLSEEGGGELCNRSSVLTSTSLGAGSLGGRRGQMLTANGSRAGQLGNWCHQNPRLNSKTRPGNSRGH